jgi:hypothetical protein
MQEGAVKSLQKPLIRSAVWGLIAGVITVAAFLATLNGFSHLTGFQAGWIALAGLASALYTGYSTLSASKSAATINQVGITVTEIDVRDKNLAIALIAKVFSMCSAQLVQVFSEPGAFDSAVDGSLDALQVALCRCHGLESSRVRVSLIMQARPGPLSGNGSAPAAGIMVRSSPQSNVPAFDFEDQAIRKQLEVVMSRQWPYEEGWLWDGLDGRPSRREHHVLSPSEREVCSYIRVGVPSVGVLCVDCSDDDSRLIVADRELAFAFANLLAVSGTASPALPTDLHALSPERQNDEEAI